MYLTIIVMYVVHEEQTQYLRFYRCASALSNLFKIECYVDISEQTKKNDDDTFPGYGLNGHDSHNVLSIEHQSMMHFEYYFSALFSHFYCVFLIFRVRLHFLASSSFYSFLFIFWFRGIISK